MLIWARRLEKKKEEKGMRGRGQSEVVGGVDG